MGNDGALDREPRGVGTVSYLWRAHLWRAAHHDTVPLQFLYVGIPYFRFGKRIAQFPELVTSL